MHKLFLIGIRTPANLRGRLTARRAFVGKLKMLLAAEKFAAGREAFASGEMNSAHAATNHVFGLMRVRCRRLFVPAPAGAHDEVDDDEDSD